MPEKIERASLESAVSIALKLHKFRPIKDTRESDLMCKEAGKAVAAYFEKCGWEVIRPGPYTGWGTTEQWPARKSES